MRKQIGATVLALAMACSLMAGCSSGSGETTAAATTEAAKEESKEEAKDEAKDTSAEAENAGSEEGSGKKYVIGLAMNTQTNPFFVVRVISSPIPNRRTRVQCCASSSGSSLLFCISGV